MKKILAIAITFLPIHAQPTAANDELAIAANVVGVIRSSAVLAIPNRYASTGAIALPQGDGYKVVFDRVDRPEWRFSVMITGGSDGSAQFAEDDWDFQGGDSIRATAVDGLLTVTSSSDL